MQNALSFFTVFIRNGLICLLTAMLGVTICDAAPCDDTAMTQGDMNDCAGQHLKAANAELERVYFNLMQSISAEGKVKLERARKIWTEYRAAECEFETSGTLTGSVHPMIELDCYANLTHEYAKALAYHLHCVEGDLSCGGQ